MLLDRLLDPVKIVFLPQGTRPHRTRQRVRVLLRAFHTQHPHINFTADYSPEGTVVSFAQAQALTEFALRWNYRSLQWQQVHDQILTNI